MLVICCEAATPNGFKHKQSERTHHITVRNAQQLQGCSVTTVDTVDYEKSSYNPEETRNRHQVAAGDIKRHQITRLKHEETQPDRK